MKFIFLCFAVVILTIPGFSQDTSITKSVIEQAEKIIAIEFTDAERDSMLGDLNENINSYQAIRNFGLQNSIPPSFIFNPLPVGLKIDEEKREPEFSDHSYTMLPEDKNELSFYSIPQLAYLIKTKQISSVELTKFFLERLKKYDPVLHCVISFTEERALEKAKQMDDELADGNYRGLLHGIPYGAKDLLAAKGYKTTWGAMPFKDQIINEDAEVIKKLDDAGAVLTAKLTMGALAWGDVWFGGKTRNPWDTTKGSSGSSAGSASAVSAGLVPFAIGTETYGSIVSPSTVCGTTGLRPTYGRVSRAGAMALSWTMDKVGPITRSAEDCAIVFNSIYGKDEADQTLIDAPFTYSSNSDLSKLKIGYVKNDFEKDYSFKKNDSLALLKLQQMGYELIPIELPDIPVNEISLILSVEAAAAFDELTLSGRDDLLVRQIKNAWPNAFRSARFIPAVEYINASRIRYILIQEMAKLFEKVDLFIAPSWTGKALLLTNLSGHPCVVLPTGFTEKETPTSITFIGNLFKEGEILELANKFQEETDHNKIHPLWIIE